MDWQIHLSTLYLEVCNAYCEYLKHNVVRMSNPNQNPDFTDEEALCVYLWGRMNRHTYHSDIHRFTDRHLRHLFPKLPSYVQFVTRLNRLWPVLNTRIERLQARLAFDPLGSTFVLDSFPIMLAKGSRSAQAKVAKELANQGDCASKDTWYHGVKVHVFAQRQRGHLSVPGSVSLSSAAEHDLVTWRALSQSAYNLELFADKAYGDTKMQAHLRAESNVQCWIPVKTSRAKTSLSIPEQGLATAIAKVRQPIEAFFAWVDKLTHVQDAAHVRSAQGLYVHLYGAFAVALFIAHAVQPLIHIINIKATL